jgi:hypothetical protein
MYLKLSLLFGRDIDPKKRNCYFQDEFPLEMHRCSF